MEVQLSYRSKQLYNKVIIYANDSHLFALMVPILVYGTQEFEAAVPHINGHTHETQLNYFYLI